MSIEDQIYQENKIVFVYFYLEGCEPCVDFKPIFTELKSGVLSTEDVDIVEISIEGNEEIGMQFGVMQFPTALIFKNGRQKAGLIGMLTKDYVEQAVEAVRNGTELPRPDMGMMDMDPSEIPDDVKEQMIKDGVMNPDGTFVVTPPAEMHK